MSPGCIRKKCSNVVSSDQVQDLKTSKNWCRILNHLDMCWVKQLNQIKPICFNLHTEAALQLALSSLPLPAVETSQIQLANWIFFFFFTDLYCLFFMTFDWKTHSLWMALACFKPLLVGMIAKWSVTFWSSKIRLPTLDTSKYRSRRSPHLNLSKPS